MKANIRRALPSDVHAVVDLIRAYALELFSENAAVTPEALLGDGFGSVLEFFIAEAEDLVGFAAWEKTYDVVSGTRGGALLAQFVLERARGTGTGDRLLNAVANEVRSMGGMFLIGLNEPRSGFARTPSMGLSSPALVSLELRRFAVADVTPAEVESVSTSLRPPAPSEH